MGNANFDKYHKFKNKSTPPNLAIIKYQYIAILRVHSKKPLPLWKYQLKENGLTECIIFIWYGQLQNMAENTGGLCLCSVYEAWNGTPMQSVRPCTQGDQIFWMNIWVILGDFGDRITAHNFCIPRKE